MARKAKIDNSILKRYARVEKKRSIKNREQKAYFLIICEGTKTEPFYFEALRNELPNNTLDIEIKGTGTNTISLVDYAIKIVEKSNKNYDRIWIVFDKDSFPDDNFDNAIHKAKSNNFFIAWSNEAFELWYLLHFQFVNTSIRRDDYCSFINREFRKKGMLDFEYTKSHENMYQLLKEHGNEKLAIVHAEALRDQYTNRKYSAHNPCTLVDKLIFELRNPEVVLNSII